MPLLAMYVTARNACYCSQCMLLLLLLLLMHHSQLCFDKCPDLLAAASFHSLYQAEGCFAADITDNGKLCMTGHIRRQLLAKRTRSCCSTTVDEARFSCSTATCAADSIQCSTVMGTDSTVSTLGYF